MNSKTNWIFIVFIFISTSRFFNAQTLIINEFSNGPSGAQEYIEFIVVDDNVFYDCGNTTPPCVDIRGWIIDDNSGYHGAGGVAGGCNRFSYNSLWQCIPIGTIITVYNDAERNMSLPPDDLSMTDNNCRLIIPINNTQLFDNNATTPGAIACSYPSTGWIAGGNWTRIGMANSGDCARLVNLAGCEVSSLCYGDVNLNTQVYYAGSGVDNVWSFSDGNSTIQGNWSEGCADNETTLDAATCGIDNQTPGSPNNPLNSAFIAQFNNNCLPIQPLALTLTSSTSQSCTCDGSASISASGSIGPYTYAWFDNFNVAIGQTSATATNLCSGNYYCVVTSSINCTDTILVSVGSICSNFGTFASATMIQNCVNNQFYNTTWASIPDQINPSGILFEGFNYGPFFQNTSTLILRGGEVKTFKNPGANVCGAKLFYTVYTIGNQPTNPVFTILDLPFKESCNVGPNNFPTGGPCFNATDQKWAKENYNIDLTTYPTGDYVIEVYYSVPGSYTSTTGCNDTIYVNNNGSNYKALFQIKPQPLISGGPLSICPGNTTTLTSNFTTGNSWSPASTNQSISVNTSGTYTLTVNLNNNCLNLSDNETVNVYASPTLEAGPNQTTCVGAGVISLNGVIGGSATGVLWSSPSGSFSSTNSASTTYTPSTTSGVVTIVLTAIGPCPSVQDQLDLLVNATPTVNAGAEQTICAGSSVNLSGVFGGSANSILWTASSGTFSNTTSTTSSYSPSISSGNVTLTLTASGPCPSVSDQVTINVSAPTIPIFTQISPICSGESITLPTTSLNGITGTWSPAVNNTATALYTFTPTAGQCASSATMTVSVNSQTLPTFNQITPICTGGTISLPSNSLNGITGAWSPVINNTATTNYSFIPTAGQCATNASMTVAVNPTYTLNDSRTICPNQLPYVWNGITFNGPGNQSATLSTINSCDSIVNMTLNVSSIITSTTNVTVCNSEIPYSWNGLTFNSAGSQSANLTATSGCDSVATLNLSIYSAQSSSTNITVCQSQIPYVWNGLTFNGPDSQTINLQDVNGCDSSATLSLQVSITLTSSSTISICPSDLPFSWNGLTFSTAGSQTASLQSFGGCDSLATLTLGLSPTYNEVENVTICSNETPYLWNGLSLSSTTSQMVTLSSINGCDSSVNLNLTVLPVYTTNLDSSVCQNELPLIWNGLTFNVAGTQTSTLTSINGCDSSVIMNVQVLELPQVSISGGGVYCTGDVIQPIIINLVGSAPYNISYTLDGLGTTVNSNQSSVSLGSNPGSYVLTLVSDQNCIQNSNLGSASIVINPIPNAPLIGNDSTYCLNYTPDTLVAIGNQNVQISWYDQPTLQSIIQTGSYYYPDNILGVTTYYVVQELNGCVSPPNSVSITFEICDVIIPTAFTPDGDHVNDYWIIDNIDALFPKNQVFIYNRWGNMIYKSEMGKYESNPWNGEYDGKDMPVSTYYFIVEFNDVQSENKTGTVSIIK